MDLQTIRNYCMNKKGSYEDFPFDEQTLVFKVGSKMFGLTNIKSEKLSLNLKCDPFMAQDLRREYDCIKPGYHMNKEHWNTVYVNGTLKDETIYWLIDLSYDLVFGKLTRKEKKEIEGINN